MDGSRIPAAYFILLASSDRTCCCLSPWKGAGMLLEKRGLLLLEQIWVFWLLKAFQLTEHPREQRQWTGAGTCRSHLSSQGCSPLARSLGA